jgi:hypothetical protein
MKNLYLTFSFLAINFSGISQLEYQFLDFNNVNALLSNGGVFFNDADDATPAYEAPSGSGNHALYSMSFWFGGEDVNGQIKQAVTTYEQEGDFFPGALTATGAATLPADEEATKKLYVVSQAQIDAHIANYDDVDYIIPNDILNWPAHGDPAYDLAFYLAPFEDLDSDGIYDPTSGDYPIIKGDKAVFMIMNDKGGIHASGSDPIGLEIHLLFYQFATDDFLNNTTFLNMRVINRGTQTIFDFHSACFVDPDLGNSTDDYVGFNADANVMYAYNGTNFDSEYGENPPAIGITLLNREVAKFAAISSDPGPTGTPESWLDYYHYMRGRWMNGTEFTEGGNGYGGDVATDFLYDGLPTEDSWSELSEDNMPGDRRMMMSNQHFETGGVLRYQMELCYDYAIVYSREGGHLENATNVVELAEAATAFYLSDGEPYCSAVVLGINEGPEKAIFIIYPNPSTGSFQLAMQGDYKLEIYSVDGRLVYQAANLNENQFIQPDVSSGTYIVNIIRDEKAYQSKLIIQ